MLKRSRQFRHLLQLPTMLLTLALDILRFLGLCVRPSPRLAAENLFLRKQLALYQERHIKPQRTTNAARLTLIWLARCFDRRQALAVVQPATYTRWHRQGVRLFWQGKSTPGRPPIPTELRALIRRMPRDNPSWGQERIANELLLKLGLRVSLRTVRNHAKEIVACDLCVVVTATFRFLYVFVTMEHATRRILHVNVTDHPTASWTLQQLLDAIPADHAYHFLIHDRDGMFSQEFDQSVRHLGLRILKTPVRSPQANTLCAQLLGTLRRECLDFLIPLTENHLRCILTEWVQHYKAGRPHIALGPGIPQPAWSLPVPLQAHRHRIPLHLRVVARPILGGLHHDDRLEKKAT
jgi:putative transposase